MIQDSFAELGIVEPIRVALRELGYEEPTPIQSQAIPALLEGRDLLATAQTGTGKTAAFGLPLLQNLTRIGGKPGRGQVRALVLAPTRELALQIHDDLAAYAANLRLKLNVIFGGVKPGRQIEALARGTDILVATPGRLLDLLGQNCLTLDRVSFLVLDEADRLLDMGFIHDVRRIIRALPQDRQSALLSATMPVPVVRLAQDILNDPVRVDVSPRQPTVERIEQRLLEVDAADKPAVLIELLRQPGVDRAIVFTRTKHRANRLAQKLEKAGFVAEALHGNKSQNARQRALERFRSGEAWILVATDIAARGIDIDGITHVFNFELPQDAESYVHRIGRTARAGAAGIAVTLCDPAERDMLRQIEKLTGMPVGDSRPQPAANAAESGGRRRRRRRGGAARRPAKAA